MKLELSKRDLLKWTAAGSIGAATQLPYSVLAQGETILKFATGTDAVTMDPIMATDIPSARAFLQVHETLVKASADGEVKGLLAESWTTSPDGLTWTFKLRTGISFSDGTPFNADAVKFNYDRLADPTNGSPRRASGTAGIESVSVVDDHTIEIRTAKPLAPLLLRLAHYNFAIVSPKAAKASGDKYSQTPVGTGPFVLSRWSRDERMTFTRNKRYWGKAPKPEAVEFQVVPEDNTRLLMLLSGDTHVISNVTPVMVPRLEASPDVKLLTSDGTRMIHLGLNRNVKPFGNAKVREAVSLAINTQQIVSQVLRDFATQAGAFDPAFIPGSKKLPPYEYNPKRAKELLAEAGYADGFTADFYFTTGRYLNDNQVAQAIQAQLGEVGIKLNMMSPEFGTFISLLDEKKVPMYMLGKGNPAFDMDGGLNIYITTNGSSNYTAYSDSEMDKMITEQRTLVDPAERKELLGRILDKIHEDMPVLALYYEKILFATRANVENVELAPSEYVTFVDTSVA
jgi:peptide/nickel transport system substrate-binding protein